MSVSVAVVTFQLHKNTFALTNRLHTVNQKHVNKVSTDNKFCNKAKGIYDQIGDNILHLHCDDRAMEPYSNTDH